MTATTSEENKSEDNPEEQINGALGHGPRIARFALAVIGGALPLAGGVFSGGAGAWSEAEQEHFRRCSRIGFAYSKTKFEKLV